MTKASAVFISIGTYPNETRAREDYAVVKNLHAAGAIGNYDAAVITKDYNGEVRVNKDELATRRGTWGGAAAGAAIGILFPPAVLATAAVGAAGGGIGAHLRRGLSRADVREFGEIIDEGQAALLIVGESKLAEVIERAGLKADKRVAKELEVRAQDLDAAVRKATTEVS